MRSGVKLAVPLVAALGVGCFVEVDEPPRTPSPSAPLASRLRLAVCEAVVASAQNGVRPSGLEVRLPSDAGGAELAVRLEASQLPQASQCADLIPAAAAFPSLPAPALAPAPRGAPAPLPAGVPGPSPYIPSYPQQPGDPLEMRR